MKAVYLFFAVACIFISFHVSRAFADTDQHCLNMCVNSGQTSTACLSQCTYNTQSSLRDKAANLSNNPDKHNVFDSPLPMGNAILPTGIKPIKKPVLSKNYQCEAACLKNGVQYQLCEKSCAKPICLPSAVLCTSTMAPAPSAALLPQNGH